MSRAVSALSRVTRADNLRDMQDAIELEVFRADTRASRGITAADLADVAAFDCEANPVAGVIGHPKSEDEAKATITGFRAEGNKLFATVTNWSNDLVEKIRDKKILNRSMAFFSKDHEANPTPGKLAPRHLGFLGAAAPGIPGMPKLADAFSFDAADDLVIEDAPAAAWVEEPADPTPIIFTAKEPKGMTEEEIAAEEKRLKDERAAFEAEQAEFAASRETSRKAGNKSRVAALVTAGKVLPADSAALELVFNALDDGELEFAADDKGSAADKLAAIIGKGPTLVDADGKPISPGGEFKAADTTDHRDITAKARELMSKDKTLTFEAAVERVTENEEG